MHFNEKQLKNIEEMADLELQAQKLRRELFNIRIKEINCGKEARDVFIFSESTLTLGVLSQIPGMDLTAKSVARKYPTLGDLKEADFRSLKKLQRVGEAKAAIILAFIKLISWKTCK